jgi:hypothetical protein
VKSRNFWFRLKLLKMAIYRTESRKWGTDSARRRAGWGISEDGWKMFVVQILGVRMFSIQRQEKLRDCGLW